VSHPDHPFNEATGATRRSADPDDLTRENAAVTAMAACLEPLRAAAIATREAWGLSAETLIAFGLLRHFAELCTSYAHPNSPEMAAANAALDGIDYPSTIFGRPLDHG
jgi:hypothetical protein